jgi:predicted enzyme related to lactoylglutathione lyase
VPQTVCRVSVVADTVTNMASRTSNLCIDAHDPAAPGASMVDDRRTAPDRGWAVLADPEGNEFCVLTPSRKGE